MFDRGAPYQSQRRPASVRGAATARGVSRPSCWVAWRDPWGRPCFQPIQGTVLIGRSPGCRVSLPWDRTVSSTHARFIDTPGGVLLQDLGSLNGTWLHNRRWVQIWVKPGDWIQVGRSSLAVVAAPTRQPVGGKVPAKRQTAVIWLLVGLAAILCQSMLMVGLTTSGLNKGGPILPNQPGPVFTYTSTVASIQASSGGELTLDNGARLSIPPGALSRNSEVEFSTIPLETTEGMEALGQMYRIQLQGGEFDTPAGLVAPLGVVDHEADLLAWNGSDWDSLGGNAQGGFISAEISNSGKYAIGLLADVILGNFLPSRNGYHFENPSVPPYFSDGICAGMAGTISWSVYPSSPPSATGWNELSRDWQRWILEVQATYQDLPDGTLFNRWDATPELNLIHDLLRDGQPVFVGLRTNPNSLMGAGHAVVAYGLEYRDELNPAGFGWQSGYLVRIYDPNYPDRDDQVFQLLKDSKGQWQLGRGWTLMQEGFLLQLDAIQAYPPQNISGPS